MKSNNHPKLVVDVIGTGIDVVSWSQALQRLSDWGVDRQSRYVCICNVHSVVTASRDKSFAKIINHADMATPDGAPIAWMLRKLGYADQQRINGPDLMWRYCEIAQSRNESLFFYGGSEQTLAALKQNLLHTFPNLKIAGSISPPFRALTPEEDTEMVSLINASGANTVWVSLGCPKQEHWMAAHRGKINAVMIGVGAAFDYHAGTLKRAPLWMQHYGLEWLYRLLTEPRRLWKRYFVTNTLFIIGAIRQLFLKR